MGTCDMAAFIAPVSYRPIMKGGQGNPWLPLNAQWTIGTIMDRNIQQFSSASPFVCTEQPLLCILGKEYI